MKINKETFMAMFYASNSQRVEKMSPEGISWIHHESDSEFQQRGEKAWKKFEKSNRPEWLKDIVSDVNGETHFVKDDESPLGVKRVPTTFVDNGLHQGETVEYWEDAKAGYETPAGCLHDGSVMFVEGVNKAMTYIAVKRALASAKDLRDNDYPTYAKMHGLNVSPEFVTSFSTICVNGEYIDIDSPKETSGPSLTARPFVNEEERVVTEFSGNGNVIDTPSKQESGSITELYSNGTEFADSLLDRTGYEISGEERDILIDTCNGLLEYRRNSDAATSESSTECEHNFIHTFGGGDTGVCSTCGLPDSPSTDGTDDYATEPFMPRVRQEVFQRVGESIEDAELRHGMTYEEFFSTDGTDDSTGGEG